MENNELEFLKRNPVPLGIVVLIKSVKISSGDIPNSTPPSQNPLESRLGPFSAWMKCLGLRNGKHYVLLLFGHLIVSKGDVQRYVHAERL